VLAAVLAGCFHWPAHRPPVRAHVYLVVVDGLAPALATPTHMPHLFAAIAQEQERSSVFPAARAVMPARTNPNHVTLLTGVTPDVHGITGNVYWSRQPGELPAKLEAAGLIEVETLFTVAETSGVPVTTLGAFGKPKLARLFAAVPGRQRGPDTLWAPSEPDGGYAPDATTMQAALASMAAAEPDLAFLNLSDVDRAGHGRGPDAADYAKAVEGADAAIGMLVADLHSRGRWSRSVLIVTADHGMAAMMPPAVSLTPGLVVAGVSGVTLVADGGVEHVYADVLGRDATDAAPVVPVLQRVAAAAGVMPAVHEVLARLPVPGIPTIAERHPDWHLDHERTGDLLLVATPRHHFVDPPGSADANLRGDHGTPEEAVVPLIVTGGWTGLRAIPASADTPGTIDVAPTVARFLGLRAPRRLDGRPIPRERAGRPIGSRPQSPH